MSTLKAVNIQHPSAATAGLTLDASGAVTGSAPWGGRNAADTGFGLDNHHDSTSKIPLIEVAV